MHRASLGLERNFDEVTCAQRLLEAQQASGYGDGLEFAFRTAAIFKANRGQNGISKLDPGGAPRGVRLGEVGHKPPHYRSTRHSVTDYGGPLSEFHTLNANLDGENLY